MAMNFVKAYQFSRKETTIHALDPRVKLFVSVGVAIIGIITLDPIEIAFLTVIQIIILALSKSMKLWLRSLKALTFFILLIAVSQYLTTQSLIQAIIFSARFILITSATSWFFYTTSPEDLGRALEQMGVPSDFSLAFTLSMRFIPVIANEFQDVYDAQRVRGLNLEKGNLLERTKAFLPILIPLFVEVIRRTYEISDALELRGYGFKEKRSHWKELKLTTNDYIFLAFFLLTIAIIVLHRLYYPLV
ncbi:MAG: energy-coupling factor transporter transmembrane protein EcfT [Thaumarchaeota archaeon]|jgi:energy-coupling factor transport system permease protein|nr:energy-coupling factor transporter transmembrane protein EcfT [Nitrososphaerota archaeon]